MITLKQETADLIKAEPKILHLTLKKQWFDMIKSGEKKEEYRQIKSHWISRLLDEYGENKIIPADIMYDIVINGFEPEQVFKAYFSKLKEFDFVVFRNGYSGGAPLMSVECLGISIGEGRPEWGAPSGECFVIKLGEIVSPIPR